MIRARLILEGNWTGWSEDIRRQLAAGNTAAMRRTALSLKEDMRRTIASAGLGRRLGNAIGVENYPRSGDSLQPAAVLRARGQSAERVIEAYSQGVTIRSRRGWLAIPVLGNLPVLGRNLKPTPELVAQRLGRPLRWVKPAGRRFGLLIADDVVRGRRSGRVRAARAGTKRRSTQAGYVRSLVMFILVPQVDVRKRLDFGATIQRAVDQLPRLVAAANR